MSATTIGTPVERYKLRTVYATVGVIAQAVAAEADTVSRTVGRAALLGSGEVLASGARPASIAHARFGYTPPVT